MKWFTDGLQNVFNNLINQRNVVDQNRFEHRVLTPNELRDVYLSGMGHKICKVKATYALKDTIQFTSTADKEFYERKLAHEVLDAGKFCVGFGRGIIVIHEKGDDLSKPFKLGDRENLIFRTFSSDIVTVGDVSNDLSNPRYYKPIYYQIRGFRCHWTRVIDMTYVRPPEILAPSYFYGGVSEFALVYSQMIADAIVQRAAPNILEKNSNFIYKVKGFKSSLRQKKDSEITAYFANIERMRSMYSAVIMDEEDSVESIAQALTNLADVDQITLRRLALVTGIPLAILVGESVRGLNATGDAERQTFTDMILSLQYEHFLRPLNELMEKLGMQPITFKENQGETAEGKVNYEKQAIENAVNLYNMGEDSAKYLQEKGVTEKDAWDEMFPEPEPGIEDMAPNEVINLFKPTEGAENGPEKT